jgi:hypothetical protein
VVSAAPPIVLSCSNGGLTLALDERGVGGWCQVHLLVYGVSRPLGGRSRSGRGVEWQGGREGPHREQVGHLAGAVTQALGAGAEGVDKGSVPDTEVECGLLVGGVDMP